jgi:hypothetical protein
VIQLIHFDTDDTPLGKDYEEMQNILERTVEISENNTKKYFNLQNREEFSNPNSYRNLKMCLEDFIHVGKTAIEQFNRNVEESKKLLEHVNQILDQDESDEDDAEILEDQMETVEVPSDYEGENDPTHVLKTLVLNIRPESENSELLSRLRCQKQPNI